LNLQNGKAQSSLLVLALLVGIFIVGWITSLFLTASFSERIIQKTALSKISKYLDFIKGFTRYALLLSTHASTKEIASQGGQFSYSGIPRSWICNLDISPNLETVKFFLSNQTQKYLNEYLANLRIKDLPSISISNFTCVDFNVNEISNKYDEKFNVSSYNSMININLRNNNVTSSNNLNIEIEQDRFWFMYRKFKEWSPGAAQKLVSGLCSCLSEICNCPSSPTYPGECESCKNTCPGFQTCLENLLESVNKDLNNTFNDKFVNCRWNLIGCYHELVPCSGSICQDWEDAPKCSACGFEAAGPLCSDLIEPKIYSIKSYQLANSNCEDLKCTYYAETKGSFEADFSCTDYKYLLSTLGDRHLIFSVHTMVKMRKRNCEQEFNCEINNGNCICPIDYNCTPCS